MSLSPSNLLTPTWAPKSQRLTGRELGEKFPRNAWEFSSSRCLSFSPQLIGGHVNSPSQKRSPKPQNRSCLRLGRWVTQTDVIDDSETRKIKTTFWSIAKTEKKTTTQHNYSSSLAFFIFRFCVFFVPWKHGNELSTVTKSWTQLRDFRIIFGWSQGWMDGNGDSSSPFFTVFVMIW